MDLITIDFETYYDQSYSLTHKTTEEYIRDPLFEVIGIGVKVNDGPTEWASGSHAQLKEWLHDSFKWSDAMVLAHNTMFDGAILGWRFGVSPQYWADTLCMGRALHGVEVGGSLKALAERYRLGAKGDEVIKALGKRRRDFTEEDLARYGDYCVNDVDLTYRLFNKMVRGFPKKELRIIDMTLRMFIEPRLELDKTLLEQHLSDVKAAKEGLLKSCFKDTECPENLKDLKEGEDWRVKLLMSNDKFAEILRGLTDDEGKPLNVPIPMKISPATGKETYAFAKNDEEFKALENHPNLKVQALMAARLGTKSTLEETRTQRFIDIAERGSLPVPIRYYAAHTGRFGGDDKINMQNLPSRGQNANKLKQAIVPPKGYTMIDSDSAQIEARVLAWLAEQQDLLEAFTDGKDVYKIMASAIYGKVPEEVTENERFVGKTTILGAGYGMGAVKFQAQLKNFGVEVEVEEARRIIDIYRRTNDAIVRLWRQAQNALVNMSRGDPAPLGRPGVLEVVPEQRAIRLPSGLLMRYDDLKFSETDKGMEFHYQTRKGRTRIYGGKVIENACQAIARCIIAEQMLRISKRYKVVLTVHDAIATVVRDAEVDEAVAYVEECMRWTPDWAKGLPVNCKSGVGKSYGDC
jgi:DNA polymerase I-like protein with 3'-5' exonuclease and polymerase domains